MTTASPRSLFADASAIVAIIDREPGWQELLAKLEQADRRLTSPLAIWEATLAMERLRAWDFEEAAHSVRSYLDAMGIVTVDVTERMGDEALRAARIYGKGQHPARLNIGDCFAYGCALVLDVPLLCKGEDFPLTDIRLA